MTISINVLFINTKSLKVINSSNIANINSTAIYKQILTPNVINATIANSTQPKKLLEIIHYNVRFRYLRVFSKLFINLVDKTDDIYEEAISDKYGLINLINYIVLIFAIVLIRGRTILYELSKKKMLKSIQNLQ